MAADWWARVLEVGARLSQCWESGSRAVRGCFQPNTVFGEVGRKKKKKTEEKNETLAVPGMHVRIVAERKRVSFRRDVVVLSSHLRD